MLKFKKLMAVMLVGLITLTGCGNKKNSLSVEETVKKMGNNMKELSSFKVDLDAGLKAKNGDDDIDFSISANADVDLKNQNLKLKLAYKGMGQDANMDVYFNIDKENNKITVYFKETDGQWKAQEINLDELTGQLSGNVQFSLSGISDLSKASDYLVKLLDSEKVKQVDPDKENYNYEMNITGSDISNYVDEIVKLIPNSDDESIKSSIAMIKAFLNNIKESINIKVSFTKGDYYLSNLSIDVKDFANELIKSIVAMSGQEMDITLSRADAKLTISDFNKVGDVVIPEEAKENAVNTAKKDAASDSAYGLRKAAQLYYMTKLLDDTYFDATTFICDGTKCSIGSEKLEIDGTIPEKGTISIDEDGKVTGSVTINGFSCNIPNSGEVKCQ